MKSNKRLRQILKERGIKHVWVSEKTGISHSVLKGFLSGRVSSLKADAAIKIAKLLNVDVEYLVGLTDEHSQEGPS